MVGDLLVDRDNPGEAFESLKDILSAPDRPSSPGLAPYRSYDHWQPMQDNYYLPGSDPKAVSVPNEGDL